LLPLMTASVAHAQSATSGQAAAPDDEGLRDIVVTGTKLGAQSLQRTPVAVSVVDSQLLEKQGLSTVQDIANYVPNLTFSRATNQAVIYLRGIGSTNAGAGSDPSVTQQVDGVYIAPPKSAIS
jgi:iron complex outermembrane recepter protein